VEDWMESAGGLGVVRAIQHVIELMRIFAPQMSKRERHEASGGGSVEGTHRNAAQ
jgi:hypothetical protein